MSLVLAMMSSAEALRMSSGRGSSSGVGASMFTSAVADEGAEAASPVEEEGSGLGGCSGRLGSEGGREELI